MSDTTQPESVLTQLRAEVAALREEIERLVSRPAAIARGDAGIDAERSAPADEAVSRRRLLKRIAGAGVAGAGAALAAGTLGAKPAFAGSDGDVALGESRDAGSGTTQVNSTGSAALFGNNTGDGDGLHGKASSLAHSGVYGENSGGGWGVFGATNGPSRVTAPRGGIQGDNGNGPGVVGTSATLGVYGVSGSPTGQTHGSAGVIGDSTSGIGVAGSSNHGSGVRGTTVDGQAGVIGISETSVGIYASGASAPLRLAPARDAGPPQGGSHQKGEVYIDSNGAMFVCTADGSTWAQVAYVQTAPATTLAANPTSVSPGAVTTVSWSNIAAPTPKDWIALAPVGAAETSFATYRYTDGSVSGSAPFTVPANTAPGSYELRLFSNNGYTRLATATITVGTTGPRITASPSSVPAGSNVTGQWSGVTNPTTKDWIGLYKNAADADTAFVKYVFTDGTASGSTSVPVPAGAPKTSTYELRLFSNNTYTRLAKSGPFSVT